MSRTRALPSDPCIICEAVTVDLTDSRFRHGARYRRRVCRECGFRWTTVEVPAGTLKKVDTLMAALEIAQQAMLGSEGLLKELRNWTQNE